MIAAPLLTIPIPSLPGGCPGGSLDPLCGAAASAGSSLIGSGAGDVLNAVTSWVVEGASWLLSQVGGILSSTTQVDLGAGWFGAHYQVMAVLATTVVLPLLLCSVVQAVWRQDLSGLARSALVQLPLALLLAAVAVQLVRLALAATDEMGTLVTQGAGADLSQSLSNLAGDLTNAGTANPAVPAFVLLLGALLVAMGSVLMWVELLVRAAAVYVAVLFLPLALASLVWPAVSHWCRRLVDTLVALVLSKFVMMAILSLAVGALGSGTTSGFTGVLAGGALLLLAAFTPFTLLRLIPAVEAGAIHQLEGARHRVQHAMTEMPRTAATVALRLAGVGPALDLGVPGTGMDPVLEAPGPDEPGPGAGHGDVAGSPASGGALAGRATPAGTTDPLGGDANGDDRARRSWGGIPMWRGTPASNDAFTRVSSGAAPEWPDRSDPGPMPVGPVPAGPPERNAPARDAPASAASGQGSAFEGSTGEPAPLGAGGSASDSVVAGDGGPPPGTGSVPPDPRSRYIFGRDDIGPVLIVPTRRRTASPPGSGDG